MTSPQSPNPEQWSTGDPAASAADPVRRRRRVLPAAIVAGVLVVVLLSLWVVTVSGAALDRSDPDAVATAFIQRYATGDPTVCDLAAAKIRTRMERDGRCMGTAGGTVPKVTVLVSQTCGNRHSFDAEVDPPGEVKKRYIGLGLEHHSATNTWGVRSVLTLDDGTVLKPGVCNPHSESYGG